MNRNFAVTIFLVSLMVPYLTRHVIASEPIAPLTAHNLLDQISTRENELLRRTPMADWAPRSPGAQDVLLPFLVNGDFETTGIDGVPAGWKIFRQAYPDNNPALAHGGSWSVRSSLLFGIFQDMEIPVSPYQTFALGGFALREFADEKAGFRNVFNGADGEHIIDLDNESPVAAQAGTYGEFWLKQEVPESAATVSLFLMGKLMESWLRFDDLKLYTEQFHFSGDGTGEDWLFTGAASIGSHTITLPAGSSATQRLVSGTENQAYFTWGKYSAGAGGQLTITESRLARDATELTVTTSSQLTLDASGGVFVADPGFMSGDAEGSGRVTLEVNSGGPIEISDLRRGFAKVEPAVITAGPTSPDTSLKLTAAWPDYLATATVQIRSANGEVIANPPTLLYGTSARAEWEPGSAPGGNYSARFILASTDAISVTVDRSFQVVREDNTTSSIPAFHADEFVRAAWLIPYFDSNTSQTFRAFELARQDGFNVAVVLCRLNQLTTVRQAAEQYGLPYFVLLTQGIDIFREYEKHLWFSKADYIARLKELFEPVADSELFAGVYLTDEPSRPISLDRTRRTFLSVSQDGTLGRPFAVFLEPTSSETLAAIQPPVGVVDVYPFNLNASGDPTSELLKRIIVENNHARNFAAIGRDLWIVTQAMVNRNHETYYNVPPSMHFAQQAATMLAGARGVGSFTYTSGVGQEGIRARDFSPTPKHSAYLRFNALADRLWPLLRQLDVPKLLTGVPFPFAASTAAGPDGTTYVFALNADNETTRTLFVELSGAPATLTDLIAERPLDLNNSGSAIISLAPGDMALFSIGPGSITGLSADSPPPPNHSTVDLLTTNEFTVKNAASQPMQVQKLEFSDDGTAIAASVLFSFLPPSPLVFHLSPDGSVDPENGPADFFNEKTGVAADGTFAVTNRFLGAKFVPPGDFTGPPAAIYSGHTGGAYDAIRTTGATWISMGPYGVRQLENSSDGLASAFVGRANFGQYRDLFGPFADGSVTVIVDDAVISNIKPEQLQESSHRQTFVPFIDGNADMNSQGLLAVPRHHRGVALLQLATTGEATLLYIFGTEALNVEAVAWIDDHTLAVADGYTTVRFYRIDSGKAELMASWQPPMNGSYMLSLAAAANGRLAVGFTDGRVIVADARALQQPTAAVDDWMLFGH